VVAEAAAEKKMLPFHFHFYNLHVPCIIRISSFGKKKCLLGFTILTLVSRPHRLLIRKVLFPCHHHHPLLRTFPFFFLSFSYSLQFDESDILGFGFWFEIRSEDDVVELLWKSGQVVQSIQTQRPIPPPIFRGSGSGGGEETVLPLPPLHPSHQNIFIQEDEMASWLYHPLRQDYFSSGVASTSATRPQSSASLAPTPPPPSVPYGQIPVERRTENFMNFLRLRGNIFSGGRVEAGPVVIESTQIGSSATPSSSAAESCVIPATHGTESRAAAITGVSRTFAVPGLGRRGKEVATETAGTSYSGVNKAETERVQIQPERETKITEDKKREETIAEIQVSHSYHRFTC